MFVNVAQPRACRNVRYSRISVARGALWDGKESQMPGYTFQERSVCAQIPCLEGQGSLLCGSLAAFIFAVVTELGLESCSEPFWELKADPALQLPWSSGEPCSGHLPVCSREGSEVLAKPRAQFHLPHLSLHLGVGEQQGAAPQGGDSCCGVTLSW